MKVGDRVEVHCDRLSYGGGRAVGRRGGAVIFVRGAAPNETVVAQIEKAHKNFFEAYAIDILTPSPNRRKSICPVFGECGGCSSQHIQYDTQLSSKEGFLRHTLRNFISSDFKITMWAAPDEYNYRNRIQV